MNKILCYDGGQPLTTEDILYLQSSFIDCLSALAKGTVQQLDCILWGIKNSQPGAVYIGGEIYVMPTSPSGYDASNKYLCIRKNQTDQRNFKDGSVHYVHEDDEAYYASATDGAYAYIDVSTAPRLVDIMNDLEGYTDESVTFPENVTGNIQSRTDVVGIQNQKQFKVVATKRMADESNTVFTTAESDRSIVYGTAVDTLNNQLLVLIKSGKVVSVYKYDGTAYNGDYYISCILKNL